jgi:hypothetical protein
MSRFGPDADAAAMVGRTTIRETSALPIFMSRRTRSHHGAILMYLAAIAAIAAAVVLRLV